MTLTQYVEKTNAAFEAASPAEKRVMIAKDVLKRLRSRNLVAESGDIISLNTIEFENGLDSFKDIINLQKGCQVCAKGALLCAYVGRVNKFSVSDTQKWNTASKGENCVHKKLKKLFSMKQLDFIEAAFERSSFLGKISRKEIEQAFLFYDKYVTINKYGLEEVNNNLLLKAICNNIIKNNGTFIP